MKMLFFPPVCAEPAAAFLYKNNREFFLSFIFS